MYMVLNLAREGKIKPAQAWNKQNSVTRTPISCRTKLHGKFQNTQLHDQNIKKKKGKLFFIWSMIQPSKKIPDNHRLLQTRQAPL